MEIVSVDVGYGYVKAVSSRRVIFPSVVGEAKQLDLSNTFGRHPDDIHNIHVVYDEREYFVGRLAEKESESTTRIFEKKRFNGFPKKVSHPQECEGRSSMSRWEMDFCWL